MRFFIGLTGNKGQKIAVALDEIVAIKGIENTSDEFISAYKGAKTVVLVSRSCTAFPVKEGYDEIVKLINKISD